MSNPLYRALKELNPAGSAIANTARAVGGAAKRGIERDIQMVKSPLKSAGQAIGSPARGIQQLRARFNMLDKALFGGKGLKTNIHDLKRQLDKSKTSHTQ
jgi:hypothetical protein